MIIRSISRLGALSAPLLMIVAASIAGTFEAAAQPIQAKHLEAELVGQNESIRPGEPFRVGLHMKMESGWHTYWQNPGDVGMATAIDWELPKGFTAGPILWPVPEKLGEAPEVGYGYEEDVLLLTEITPPNDLPAGSEVALTANATWLICRDICIPGKGKLALKLPVRETAPKPDPRWSTAFAQSMSLLPTPSGGWSSSALLRGDTIHLYLKPADGGKLAPPAELYFFAADQEVADHSAPQRVTATGDRVEISFPRSHYANAPASRVRGIVAAPGPWADGRRGLWVDVALPSSSDAR